MLFDLSSCRSRTFLGIHDAERLHPRRDAQLVAAARLRTRPVPELRSARRRAQDQSQALEHLLQLRRHPAHLLLRLRFPSHSPLRYTFVSIHGHSLAFSCTSVENFPPCMGKLKATFPLKEQNYLYFERIRVNTVLAVLSRMKYLHKPLRTDVLVVFIIM